MDAKNASVLIIGSGGREHAIALQLAKDGVKHIFCLPGNGGTASFCTNIEGVEEIKDIVAFAKTENIDLTIVGSEYLLEQGITDDFILSDLRIIGPSPEAAQLETSKSFTRNLLNEINCINQPLFRTCICSEDANRVIREHGLPLVIKANGLANGKGVYICKTKRQWLQALSDLCKKKIYGNEASKRIIIEKFLDGVEMSVFALCDHNSFRIIGTAQDYKRAYDNDEGPNTGGMGAISPSPYATTDLMEKIKSTIIAPVLGRMKYDRIPFTGFLYAGIMLVEGEPYVLEFNVRLGDPETQVILPLITSSFFDMLYKAAEDRLSEAEITFSEKSAATIVKAAKGYPGEYEKNTLVKNVGCPSYCDIIHAGTILDNGQYRVSKGRVLNITRSANTLEQALEIAYIKAEGTKHFEGEYFRKDIGKDALAYLKSQAKEKNEKIKPIMIED
jgi:phosphoribosylamine--glycine ligase